MEYTMTTGAKMQEEHMKPQSERGGVVVLDFGGQYTQLIARRIREQKVFSAILPCTTSIDEIRKYEPAGVILSGGPNSVYAADAPVCDSAVLSAGVPVLGICYGMQWITHTLGGHVERAGRREYGRAKLNVENLGEHGSPLFKNIPHGSNVWNSHGDHVRALAPGFRCTAKTENAVGAIEDAARRIYAVEFHPEVNHTAHGTEILRNFLFEVCKAEPKWNGAAFVEETVDAIRK